MTYLKYLNDSNTLLRLYSQFPTRDRAFLEEAQAAQRGIVGVFHEQILFDHFLHSDIVRILRKDARVGTFPSILSNDCD